MLKLILIIAIAVTVICGIITLVSESEFFGFFALIGLIVSILSGTAVIMLKVDIETEYTIDQKIEMYQDENANIEATIQSAVEHYMQYEQDTYKEFKRSDDAIVLVSMFPELKSDALVQQQIEVYTANNQKVKELKEEKINLQKKKYWLNFNKG